jgi:hypothetical protein
MLSRNEGPGRSVDRIGQTLHWIRLRRSIIVVLTHSRDEPSLNAGPVEPEASMATHRKNERTPAQRAALFKFLDAYDNGTYPDEAGCLLGQLAQLRELESLDRPDERTWHRAVSLALTAH